MALVLETAYYPKRRFDSKVDSVIVRDTQAMKHKTAYCEKNNYKSFTVQGAPKDKMQLGIKINLGPKALSPRNLDNENVRKLTISKPQEQHIRFEHRTTKGDPKL